MAKSYAHQSSVKCYLFSLLLRKRGGSTVFLVPHPPQKNKLLVACIVALFQGAFLLLSFRVTCNWLFCGGQTLNFYVNNSRSNQRIQYIIAS